MSVDLRKRRRRPGSFEYVSENSWIVTDQNNIPPPPVINSTSWIGEYVRLTTGKANYFNNCNRSFYFILTMHLHMM